METRALGTYSRVEAWTRTPDKDPAAASASPDGSVSGAEAARMRTRTLGFTFGKLGVRYVSRTPEQPAKPEGDRTVLSETSRQAGAEAARAPGSPGSPSLDDTITDDARLFDARPSPTLADTYGPYRAGATLPASIPAPVPNSAAASAGASDESASELELRRGLMSYRRALSARLDVPPRMLDGMV